MDGENQRARSIVAIVALTVLLLAAVIFAGWFWMSRSKNLPFRDAAAQIPVIGAYFAKVSSEEQSLLEQLNNEKRLLEAEWQKLEKQSAELNRKQKELEQKELELSEREMKITQEQAKLEETLEDIKNVAQYYEMMAPSKAAAIMETMEDELVIKIFKNMKKEAVSEILASMDPKKAASITKKLSANQ